MSKKVKYLSLEENLINHVADEVLSGKTRDLSKISVVFPSRRMGIFLKKEFSEKTLKNTLLPKIFTIDEFVFYSYELLNPFSTIIDETSALIQLFSLLKEKKEIPYFPEVDRGFLSLYPSLKKLYEAVEEISIEAKNNLLKNFKEFVELGEYREEYKNFIKNLPEIKNGFHEKLKGLHKYTRGMAYEEVARNAKEVSNKLEFEKIILSGFNSLSYSEVQFFKEVIRKENVIMIMKGDYPALDDPTSPFALQKKALKDLNISSDDIEYHRGKSWRKVGEKVRIMHVTDIEGEMEVVRETLKNEFLDDKRIKNPPDAVGIVLSREESLIPFVQNVVSSFNEDEIPPFNITLGYPFSRTPLYELINSIISLKENYNDEKGFYFKNYLELIRHPYVKLTEKYEGEDFLRTGIHYIEDTILEYNLFYFKEEELDELLEKKYSDKENFKEIKEEINEMHKTFIFKKETMGEFVEFLKDSFYKIYEKNKNRYLFLNEFVGEGITIVNELEEMILRSEFLYNEKDFSVIGSFIREFFGSRKINFFGSPLKGVQIMGLLEFRGLNFKKIIFTDAVEGILPPIYKYDPLLPADIRAIFGMRTYHEMESLRAYDFFTLLGSADEIVVVIPQKIDGEFTQKSRFIERIIYENEKSEISGFQENYSAGIYIKEAKKEDIEKSENVKEFLKKFSFSPSSLETYILCPAKFYYQNILGLEEKVKIEDEPDHGMTGTIVHESLKRLYEKKKLIFESDYKKIEDEYSKIIEEVFQENGFKRDSGILRIRKWAILKKVLKFLKEDIKRIRENEIEIIYLEKDFKEDIEFKNGVSATFKGRIDRIEKEKDIFRIIDYKTGKKIAGIKKGSELEEIENFRREEDYQAYLNLILKTFPSFQILFYIKLFSEHEKENILTIDGGYVFLKENEAGFKTIFNKIDDNLKAKIFNIFEDTVSKIIYDIYNKETFPRIYKKKICENCPYKSLCFKS